MKLNNSIHKLDFSIFKNISSATLLSLMIGITSLSLVACVNQPTYRPNTNSQKNIPHRHQVQRGDTVSKIAARYGLNWREISRINNLDDKHTIRTGQWLVLQPKSSHRFNTKINTVNTSVDRPLTHGDRSSMLATSKPPTSDTITKKPISPSRSYFSHPIDKRLEIVRHFGTPVNLNGQPIQTEGIWFLGVGNEPVRASQSGKILKITPTPTGSFIDIAHDNGFISSYLHVADVAVKSGQKVNQGDQIARIKQQSNGAALLEFRISNDGKYINPITVLR